MKEKSIKVTGTAKQPGIQNALKAIRKGDDVIVEIYAEGATIILNTEHHSVLAVGEVKKGEAEFLASLHAPMRPAVTGGEWLVLDENGKEVAQVRDHTELTEDQRLYIVQGLWKTQRKRFGLTIHTQIPD